MSITITPLFFVNNLSDSPNHRHSKRHENEAEVAPWDDRLNHFDSKHPDTSMSLEMKKERRRFTVNNRNIRLQKLEETIRKPCTKQLEQSKNVIPFTSIDIFQLPSFNPDRTTNKVFLNRFGKTTFNRKHLKNFSEDQEKSQLQIERIENSIRSERIVRNQEKRKVSKRKAVKSIYCDLVTKQYLFPERSFSEDKQCQAKVINFPLREENQQVEERSMSNKTLTKHNSFFTKNKFNKMYDLGKGIQAKLQHKSAHQRWILPN